MPIFDKEKLKKIKEKEVIEKKHTIMIVDDEEAHLSSMVSLLSEEYDIITAKDGQEALDITNKMKQPKSLSLIISDQRMPGLNGIQLLERLMPIIPKTIRIILTGYLDIPVIIDSINKAQIYKFISKPFEPEDFKLSVKRAVEAFETQQKLEEYRRILEEQNLELSQKNKELKELSLTDPLTGLRNTRYLEEFMPLDVFRVQRNYEGWLKDITKPTPLESDLVFIMLDIDKLKDVNDKHGHEAGSNILKQVAGIFRKECRKSDVLIRKGGDEFLIVNRSAEKNQIHELPEKLLKEVEKKQFDIGEDKPINITCSIGFACYPFIRSQPNKVEWNDVVKIADRALYASKYSGRNAWVGLMGTDRTQPDNLYQRIQKDIKQLLAAGELKALSSKPEETLLWEKS